ncbi:MAG: cupredoxin domain-containing protein [Dehalococcoidia bacterium]
MHVRLIRIGAVALMLATALVFVGCSDDEADEPVAGGDPTAAADPEADPEADPVAGGGHEVGTLTNFDETVEVDLMEWAVNPDRASVPAGLVRFVATNDGSEVHEFVLIEGTSKDGEEVTEIEGIAPGDSREIAARLEPGTYQLACLIVEVEGGETEDHYDLGMHIEFTVE